MLADRILSLLPWLVPAILIGPIFSSLSLVNFIVLAVGATWSVLLIRYRKEDGRFQNDKEQIFKQFTGEINSLRKRKS